MADIHIQRVDPNDLALVVQLFLQQIYQGILKRHACTSADCRGASRSRSQWLEINHIKEIIPSAHGFPRLSHLILQDRSLNDLFNLSIELLLECFSTEHL